MTREPGIPEGRCKKGFFTAENAEVTKENQVNLKIAVKRAVFRSWSSSKWALSLFRVCV
jgi:hypothetical protein